MSNSAATSSFNERAAARKSRGSRTGPGWFRAESPCGIALRTRGPRERSLARQLLDPEFLVVRARQRREKGNHVVDIFLGQSQRLDVLVEIGIVQSIALV